MKIEKYIKRLTVLRDDLQKANSQFAADNALSGSDTKQDKINHAINRLGDIIEDLNDELEAPKDVRLG